MVSPWKMSNTHIPFSDNLAHHTLIIRPMNGGSIIMKMIVSMFPKGPWNFPNSCLEFAHPEKTTRFTRANMKKVIVLNLAPSFGKNPHIKLYDERESCCLIACIRRRLLVCMNGSGILLCHACSDRQITSSISGSHALSSSFKCLR